MRENRVRLPRLLDRYTYPADGVHLGEIMRLDAAALSVEMNLYPLSTAELSLSMVTEDYAGIRVHDMMELFTQNGSAGVFRVQAIDTTYPKQAKFSLNHALDVLNDALWVPDEGINTEEEFKGTVWELLQKALTFQTQGVIRNGNELVPFWVLAEHPDDTDPVRTKLISRKLRLDNILEIVSDIGKEFDEYRYTFNFDVFPWVLDFVPLSSAVSTEFRLTRNLSSLSVTMDDSDLCTHLYLSVSGVDESGEAKKDVLTYYEYQDNDPVTGGMYYWGDIPRTAGMESAQEPDSAAWQSEADAWAAKYFSLHRHPSIQIEVDGLELQQVTGAALDGVHLGQICRVTLPDFPAHLPKQGRMLEEERIVSVTWPDALRQPGHVKLSMANRRQTAEDSIAAANKNAKKAGMQTRTISMTAQNTAEEVKTIKSTTGHGGVTYSSLLNLLLDAQDQGGDLDLSALIAALRRIVN